jgi:hypothetical protein
MVMLAATQTEQKYYLQVVNKKTFVMEKGVQYSIRTENKNDSINIKLFYENEFIIEYPEGTRFRPIVTKKFPQMYIDIPKDTEIKRDEWLNGAAYTLVDGERQLQNGMMYEGLCDIKGRGNTTWNVGKQPYNIRLQEGGKKPLLGMPAQRHWVLLANAMDFSWLRNAVAFEISKIFNNIIWTPKSEYVELYLNGNYAGIYQLTEQIRIDENRVNIPKISNENPDGGYLIELVNSLKDEPWFKLYHNRTGKYVSDKEVEANPRIDVMNANVKDPDQNLENVWNIITSGVWAAEEAIYGDNFKNESSGYCKYFDLPSAIDLYWVNEFTKNPDANHGSIFFYYNPEAKKYFFGPVWDFDLTMGNYNTQNVNTPSNFYSIENHLYWIPRMLEDPFLKNLAKERWKEKNSELQSILDFIDRESEYLSEARKRDTFIAHYYNNPQGSYKEEIALLKSFIETRIRWINENIQKL